MNIDDIRINEMKSRQNDPVELRKGGPYPLYCTKCRCWVPNEESSAMRFNGYFMHSHVCGVKGEYEIYEDLLEKPLTLEQLQNMDGQPVWCDNGESAGSYRLRWRCYIVNNEYEVHGRTEPCGIDMWGHGTSLSLLAKCGLYKNPFKEDTTI